MLFIGIADVPYIPISEDRGFTALLISVYVFFPRVLSTLPFALQEYHSFKEHVLLLNNAGNFFIC